jgi:DNA primase
MTRRFSPQELTFLRNRVPITHVIKSLSEMPTRSTKGKLSFACPLCGGFDTAINGAHNLARCFECRHNFNPIELVMYQRQIGFVEAVIWLKNRINKTSTDENSLTSARNNNQLTALGNILHDIMPALSQHKPNDAQQSITQRLETLEHSVKHLCRLIDQLRSSLD